MRLIDADALIEVLGLDQHNNGEGMTSTEEWIAEAITTAPTIAAEPVRRGLWVTDNWPPSFRACSSCGEHYRIYNFDFKFKHCPNCGAKMEGGEA